MAVGDSCFKRYKLPPKAFPIGPEKGPEPSDLVDQEKSGNLVGLTDDVSLRTSGHYSALLSQAQHFLGSWVAPVLDLHSSVLEPRDDGVTRKITLRSKNPYYCQTRAQIPQTSGYPPGNAGVRVFWTCPISNSVQPGELSGIALESPMAITRHHA